MPQNSLFFVFNEKWQILLCMKKRDFWVWKWNWAWWKTQEWETVIKWAIRELEEETWIKIEDEAKVFSHWILHFIYKAKPHWNQDVHVFSIRWFTWNFIETEEMQPKWFNLEEIPYENMWEDDAIWLKHAINWEVFEFEFIFWMNSKIESWKKFK